MRDQKTERDQKKTGGSERKRPLKKLAAAAFAAGLVAGCGDFVVNNYPYDPTADASTLCSVSTGECLSKTVDFRESESTEGTSEHVVGNGVLRLEDTLGEPPTKATMVLAGCEKTAEAELGVGETATLTINDDSYDVTVNDITTDSTGLKVNVTITPVCSE